MTPPHGRRWAHLRLRRVLRPANRYGLDRWVAASAARLDGLVLNIGAGEDERPAGRRTIRIDRYAPRPDVRADVDAALPFTSGACDAVVCTEVLEHVRHPAALLDEMRRVLRPGGTIIVSVPFMVHYHPDPIDAMRLSPFGLEDALTRAGFEVEFVGGIGSKAVVLLMLAESANLLTKVLVRVAQLPFGLLLRGRRPINREWSDWCANAVAIARRPGANR